MAKGNLQQLLRDQESVRYTARTHWIVFIVSIFTEIVITLVLAGIALAVNILIPPTILYSVIVFLLLLLVPTFGAVRDFFVWWNQQYVITTQRVIRLSGVIKRNTTDIAISEIKATHLDQSSFGRLFNFGDIRLTLTAGKGETVFKSIGDPARFIAELPQMPAA